MIANRTILHFMHFASAIFLLMTVIQSVYLVYSMNKQAEDDHTSLNDSEETFCRNDVICETKLNEKSLKEIDFCAFSIDKYLIYSSQEVHPHFFYNTTHNTYLLAITLGAFLNNFHLLKIGII
jgi:hypothetical protein